MNEQKESFPEPKPAPQGQPNVPPTLVFKPDPQHAVRVARVRAVVLVTTVLMLVAAFVILFSYHPSVPVQRASEVAPRVGETVPRVETAPAVPVRPQVSDPVAVARVATAAVDTCVARAVDRWLRAGEFLPQGPIDSSHAEGMVGKMRRASIIADSARLDIVAARMQAEMVKEASRLPSAGNSAYRISVLYSTVESYLKLLSSDADDRLQFYRAAEQAAAALAAGDESESEIQQNVANSYLRRSEERQRSIRRQAGQVREAAQNLTGSAR